MLLVKKKVKSNLLTHYINESHCGHFSEQWNDAYALTLWRNKIKFWFLDLEINAQFINP